MIYDIFNIIFSIFQNKGEIKMNERVLLFVKVQLNLLYYCMFYAEGEGRYNFDQ